MISELKYFSITNFVTNIFHFIMLKIVMFLRISAIRKGKGSRIYSNVFVKHPENIQVGKNVFINYGCILWATEDSSILIGDDVIFGPRVSIIASNHGTSLNNLIRLNDWKNKDIFIGNDVWIGANVVILPGVSIGNGAVIAA